MFEPGKLHPSINVKDSCLRESRRLGEDQQVSALSATCLRLWGQINSKLVSMAIETYMHLLTDVNNFNRTFSLARRASVLAWHASGPKFDPHVRYILSCRFNIYSHSLSSADSRDAVVTNWASSLENVPSGVSDLVRLKLACSATEASMRLEILVTF